MSGEAYQFIGKKFTKKLIKIIKTFPMIGEKFSDDWIFVGLKILQQQNFCFINFIYRIFFISVKNLNRPTKFISKT